MPAMRCPGACPWLVLACCWCSLTCVLGVGASSIGLAIPLSSRGVAVKKLADLPFFGMVDSFVLSTSPSERFSFHFFLGATTGDPVYASQTTQDAIRSLWLQRVGDAATFSFHTVQEAEEDVLQLSGVQQRQVDLDQLALALTDAVFTAEHDYCYVLSEHSLLLTAGWPGQLTAQLQSASARGHAAVWPRCGDCGWGQTTIPGTAATAAVGFGTVGGFAGGSPSWPVYEHFVSKSHFLRFGFVYPATLPGLHLKHLWLAALYGLSTTSAVNGVRVVHSNCELYGRSGAMSFSESMLLQKHIAHARPRVLKAVHETQPKGAWARDFHIGERCVFLADGALDSKEMSLLSAEANVFVDSVASAGDFFSATGRHPSYHIVNTSAWDDFREGREGTPPPPSDTVLFIVSSGHEDDDASLVSTGWKSSQPVVIVHEASPGQCQARIDEWCTGDDPSGDDSSTYSLRVMRVMGCAQTVLLVPGNLTQRMISMAQLSESQGRVVHAWGSKAPPACKGISVSSFRSVFHSTVCAQDIDHRTPTGPPVTVWEGKLLEMFGALVQPNDVVVDIGSGYGLFTERAAFKGASVHSIGWQTWESCYSAARVLAARPHVASRVRFLRGGIDLWDGGTLKPSSVMQPLDLPHEVNVVKLRLETPSSPGAALEQFNRVGRLLSHILFLDSSQQTVRPSVNVVYVESPTSSGELPQQLLAGLYAGKNIIYTTRIQNSTHWIWARS